MFGYQVACPIETRLAVLRMEFAEAVADCHVRADDQYRVREAAVAVVVDLIQDAPCREHPHDGRLASTGSHLAGIALERLDALLFGVGARLVERHLDSLPEVGARFVEEDDRFR